MIVEYGIAYAWSGVKWPNSCCIIYKLYDCVHRHIRSKLSVFHTLHLKICTIKTCFRSVRQTLYRDLCSVLIKEMSPYENEWEIISVIESVVIQCWGRGASPNKSATKYVRVFHSATLHWSCRRRLPHTKDIF